MKGLCLLAVDDESLALSDLTAELPSRQQRFTPIPIRRKRLRR